MNPQTWSWIETIALLKPLQVAIAFCWAAHDPTWLMVLKRTFLLLPLGAVALGYWTSAISLPVLLIRTDRKVYINTLLTTWWDLGRAVFSFWGGTFRFVLQLGISLFGAVQTIIVGTWVVIQDVVLIPVRAVGNLGSNVLNPTIPWIAVGLTFFWSVFEAMIFTYVTTPLVIDTLSNLTGGQLTESFIRIPLFAFMLFIALGSYSVLSTWTKALKDKDVPAIIKIGVIECVALFVEVVFLYREFVDALVPWFAQHTSGKFELGIVGTLGIAGLTWLGIRSLSWFLFAASGTPTIMAIIQGTGISARGRSEGAALLKGNFKFSIDLLGQLKKEFNWVQNQGEALLGSAILPPLQVLAGAINFCTLLVTNQHMFDLPFTSIKDLKDSKAILEQMGNEARRKKAA